MKDEVDKGTLALKLRHSEEGMGAGALEQVGMPNKPIEVARFARRTDLLLRGSAAAHGQRYKS